tara:strand:- start:852 stop:2063 length:1212 start_codon:yes stop_codon:yes gene_type:complete
MTSRILQEDSSLILTEASDVLINNNYVATNGFITNAPVVQNTAITQVYVSNVISITTGQPIVSISTMGQLHILNTSDFVTGQPIVPSVTVTEDEVSTASPIVTGTPEVNSTPITQINSFSAGSILTGRPDVEDAADPNEQYEQVVQQMFGGWPKRIYDHTDLAISRGHSIGYRTLYKFGYNPDVDTQEETVWGNAGNYIWLDSAVTMFVSSTSANDSGTGIGARTILIQGLDEDYNEIEETITLNGQTQVTTQLSYLRVYRAFVTLAGSNEGTSGVIYIGSSGATGGVPNSAVYASISIGNQTQIAAYTVPAGYTLYIDEINFTAAVSQAQKLVHCKFNSRDYGSNVFRTRFVQVIQSNQLIQSFKYPQGFAEKTDLECRVSTDTSNTAIGASFQGVLIKNET